MSNGVKLRKRGRLGTERAIEEERVAVVIPCFNEAKTIQQVVAEVWQHLPQATVFVFDNNSTDGSADLARRAGAVVVPSPVQGKGNVVRHMTSVVDAGMYVLMDGDGTYPAAALPAMVEYLRNERIDMLIGTRLQRHEDGAFRTFHLLGNRVISGLVNLLFSAKLTDVLSGYRVLSRTFVDLVWLRQGGFEVETEMTAQALAKGLSVAEMPVEYRPRPAGSVSKLNTWRDGFLITKCIVLLFKDYKPLAFFSTLSFLLAAASVMSGIGPVREFIQTGYVFLVPRAILATGLGILSIVFLTAGLILDTVSRLHEETIDLCKLVLRDRP